MVLRVIGTTNSEGQAPKQIVRSLKPWDSGQNQPYLTRRGRWKQLITRSLFWLKAIEVPGVTAGCVNFTPGKTRGVLFNRAYRPVGVPGMRLSSVLASV